MLFNLTSRKFQCKLKTLIFGSVGFYSFPFLTFSLTILIFHFWIRLLLWTRESIHAGDCRLQTSKRFLTTGYAVHGKIYKRVLATIFPSSGKGLVNTADSKLKSGSRHPKTLQVNWSIRALRYMTLKWCTWRDVSRKTFLVTYRKVWGSSTVHCNHFCSWQRA